MANEEIPQISQISQISQIPQATTPQHMADAPAIDQVPTERTPSITAKPDATKPQTTHQAVEPPRDGRRGVRRPLLVALACAAVVLIAVLVPLLQQLGTSQVPHALAVATATRTTATATAQSTANAHAYDWVAQLHQAAQAAYIDGLVSHMTLDEEIGQMLMIEFQEPDMTSGLAYELTHYHIGSVILYSYNVVNVAQTQRLDRDIQATNPKIPLLISTDQEGGVVNRLASIDGPLPSAAVVGARNDPAYAQQRGAQDAHDLYNLGINANMAPVIDVGSPNTSTVGDRIFADTPEQVARIAGAYLDGLQSTHQVVGCLKHFPGLGAVGVDPHKELTTLNRSRADLEKIDWAPYASILTTSQVDMVMVTHVVLPAIDPTLPASISRPVVTGILRDTLHFNGVIVTDGIYMKALSTHYTFDQIVLDSVQAGVDLISSTYSLSTTDEAFRVLRNAVQDGTLSKQQIDASVQRILLMKLHYGLLTMPSA